MTQPTLIVFPTNPDHLDAAKKLFRSLIGAEPYVDSMYYVGWRTDGREVGLDPYGPSSGPIAYWDTEDIAAKVAELTAAGWSVTSDARDVGGGLLVAQLTDGDGNIVGLRQGTP